MSPVRNSDGSTSYKVDRPAAPYLKWERNDQFNVGIDFGILDGRVRLTADWYNKLSKDILLELAQPAHMGYSALLMNSGEIKIPVLNSPSAQIRSIAKISAGTQILPYHTIRVHLIRYRLPITVNNKPVTTRTNCSK